MVQAEPFYLNDEASNQNMITAFTNTFFPTIKFQYIFEIFHYCKFKINVFISEKIYFEQYADDVVNVEFLSKSHYQEN